MPTGAGMRHFRHRRKVADYEAEEESGFWEDVRLYASQGLSRTSVAELMGYSPSGFRKLLKRPHAPGDIPWWKVPASAYEQDGPPRWAVRKAAASRAIKATHQGRTQTLGGWAKELGFYKSTLLRRYRKGLRGARLFEPTMPPQEKGRRYGGPAGNQGREGTTDG